MKKFDIAFFSGVLASVIALAILVVFVLIY